MDFSAFLRDVTAEGRVLRGAEVWRDGRLLHSWGDTEETPYELYSVTKSVLSVALGVAWDRGLIDFGRPLAAYLPPESLRALPPAQRGIWETMPLRRLMTMSVEGLPFRPEGENWLDFSLRVPVPRPERAVFHYSNLNAFLAGVALTRAAGQDAGTFIADNVLGPLGITDCSFTRSPEGYFYGASGMRMRVRDLSRIGLMLCAGGLWEGKRILSETYIREAAAPLQMNREGGYGYFFWKAPGGFAMHGKFKQRCFVLPSRGLVITWLADIDDPSAFMEEAMARHLLGPSD